MFPDNGDLKEGDNGWIGPYDPRCITRQVDDDTMKREPAYEVSAGAGCVCGVGWGRVNGS